MHYALQLGALAIGVAILLQTHELATHDQKVNKLTIEIVTKKPGSKNGLGIMLTSRGLRDFDGRRLDESDLRKILRLSGQKECVLFVNIEQMDMEKINMATLRDAIRAIDAARDTDLATYVYFILPRP
jgi:hypothetical protein